MAIPVASDIAEPNTAAGAMPTKEELAAARSQSADLDDMFSDAAPVAEPAKPAPVKAAEPTLEPEPEPAKPRLKPANPPKVVAPVTVEPASTRPPKTLYAIPPEDPEEEEVVDVEPAEEPAKAKVEDQVEEDPTPVTQSPDMVKTLAEALRQAFPEKITKTEPEVPALTDEQRDEALKVFKPAKDLFDRLSNPETRDAAMAELVGGLREEQRVFAFNMATRVAQDHLANYLQSQQAQVTTQQNLAKVKDEFFAEYPTLNEERFIPTVRAATLLLKAEGFNPTSAAHFKKTLAEKTEAILKGANPSFSLASKQTKTTTVPKPAVTKARGGGGDGGLPTSAKSSTKAAGTEVFD